MIKAIIFDLNGIFIQSPNLTDRIEKDFGIKSEIFLPKLIEIMNKVRQPAAGASFVHWKPVLEEFGIKLSEEEFWKYWFDAETPSERMISFAQKLKEKGIKVFVLSNNFKERAEYYEHYPWVHEAIDKAYFSWQTGFVKPDVEAWELVLKENSLQPEECLYFDDQERNLRASREVGIESFIFVNEEETEKIINRYIK